MDSGTPRKPGRPSRPVTRDQLLGVAREAFSELGYAGASMDNIASRAGIRKSSLFHHFATKDELYKQALAGVVADLGQHVVEALQSEGPFHKRMEQSTLAVQRYLGKRRVAARLLLREFMDGGHAIVVAGEAVDAALQAAVDLLEQGMAEGAIPKQDARHIVMSTAGVHLLFFGLPDVSARLFKVDVFSEQVAEARAKIVVDHIRRVTGLVAS